MNNQFLVILTNTEVEIYKTDVISDELLVSTINDDAIIIDTTVGKRLTGFDLNTRELHWEDINEL